MALIGYARVSTQDQHLRLQQDALKAAGCIKIFTDTISGAKQERKGLEEAIAFLREGDILVVWRLDRLGRQSSPTHPLLWWGINSTLFGIHQLDEPPWPHSAEEGPPMRQGRGIKIHRVTTIQHGRLHSPLT
jgi:hypothetical protein